MSLAKYQDISGSYASQKGSIISGKVSDPKPRRSPLVQGGLEILIEMTVMWNNASNIEILRKNIESLSFLEYKDDSKAILKELGAVERKW